MPRSMRVVSWNVNSVRTRLPRLLAFLERQDPDVVCLQETKVSDDLFPRDEIEAAGYHTAIYGQKTYNGVAILSKTKPTAVTCGFPGDPVPEHHRVIGADIDGLRILDLYVVNGKSPQDPAFETKMRWYDALHDWIAATTKPSDPLLVVGDFNVAPDERDVHDPERWAGKIHCTEAERQRVQTLQNWGLYDLHREITQEPGIHTWWDYRLGAFARGWGLRIDLALGTRPVADALQDVTVDREERKETMGEGKPSDHAPLLVDLDWQTSGTGPAAARAVATDLTRWQT